MGKWPSASSLRSVDFHGFSSSLPLTWPLSRNSRARRFGEGEPVMDQRIDPADCEVIEQGLHPSGADIGSVVEAVDREEPHRRTFRRIGWHRRVDEPLPRPSEYYSNKLIAILTNNRLCDNLTGREFSERFGGSEKRAAQQRSLLVRFLRSGQGASDQQLCEASLQQMRGPNWQRDRFAADALRHGLGIIIPDRLPLRGQPSLICT